ncbi:MAG: phosphopantetheine-binding protein [Pseudomonadota bacterium]|nr:phosphopantetheine-binding protein [Pseudomonadota bacterium]
MTVLDDIKFLIADVLRVDGQVQRWDGTTPLLGSIPEFDSMAVVSLLTAIEEHFGIVVEDDEISAETFETVGSLADFVGRKVSGQESVAR